ncbi:MAG: twin-arginine translocation signal domain-containing protein, partial [Thermoleophilia bacterium]|nr:twin-arginine translocation signal domain-containing protein [Thermoleophilia bacterium]
MQEKEEKKMQEGPGILESKAISRREFLKVAGIAGATVGLGAGLGGVLAACGAQEETTTTGGTTPTTGGSTTSVSTGPEMGRELKFGLVSPKTGALALFAKADDWWTDFATKAVPDGIVCGDGKLHPFKFVRADSQSDSNRAAQVAGDL